MPIRNSSAWCIPCIVLAALCILWVATDSNGDQPEKTSAFESLQDEYGEKIHPLLTRYCLDCHTTLEKQGELDLERFIDFESVRSDPPTWQKVAEMLANGEMPPEDAEQPAEAERAELEQWVASYLDAEALANAGDPGPVVLRRLNNAGVHVYDSGFDRHPDRAGTRVSGRWRGW